MSRIGAVHQTRGAECIGAVTPRLRLHIKSYIQGWGESNFLLNLLIIHHHSIFLSKHLFDFQFDLILLPKAMVCQLGCSFQINNASDPVLYSYLKLEPGHALETLRL